VIKGMFIWLEHVALVPVPIRDRRLIGKCEGFENVTRGSMNVEKPRGLMLLSQIKG
jgi:hypothetical protein